MGELWKNIGRKRKDFEICDFWNILKDTGKTKKKIVGNFSTKFESTAENITEILR